MNFSSEKIAFAGLLCACMVVIDHAQTPASPGSSAWWVMSIVSRGICQIAVPFFFTVSGFFLAAHIEENGWWKREMLKRVKSLCLPFLLWSLIGTCVLLPIVDSESLPHGWAALRYVGLYPFALPFVTPLWYLRSLIILVAISPLLVWLVRMKYGVLVLAGWYIVSIALSKMLAQWPAVNNFLGNFVPLKWGCFWFSLGVYLRDRGIVFKPSFCKTALIIIVGILLVLGAKFSELNGFEYAALMQKISIPFLLAGFWYLAPRKGQPHALLSYAFPIYLIHMPIIAYCRKFVPAEGLLAYASTITIAIVVSIAVAFLLKTMPKVAKLLFGGR